MARLCVHEYFDHYLTDIFPQQTRALFAAHNQDAEAHDPRFSIHTKNCPTARRVDRLKWMIAGGSVVAGATMTLLVEHLPAILKALL
jgi:hypothetical protein